MPTITVRVDGTSRSVTIVVVAPAHHLQVGTLGAQAGELTDQVG